MGSVLALAAGLVATAVAAPDPVGQAIDQTVNTNKAAQASQSKVNTLDDQTRQMLERYRSATWQAQQLTVYADQLGELVKAQDAERVSLQRQTAELENTEREILPLMMRMVDGLEKFIALDLPFLASERKERLENLKRMMSDPDATAAEKFKRILEAWQIEAEYGRSLGSERADVDGRTVDVLRVGRTALFYLTADGENAGRWNPDKKAWETLPHKYVGEIRHGLRMARETAAPDLLKLPMPAAGAGS
jgi:hypothetical protein